MAIQMGLQEALRRLGLGDATNNDPLSRYRVLMLKEMLAKAEIAMEDEGVDRDVTNRVLQRLIFGCVPSAVDAQVRMDMHEAKVRALSRPRLVDTPGSISDSTRGM